MPAPIASECIVKPDRLKLLMRTGSEKVSNSLSLMRSSENESRSGGVASAVKLYTCRAYTSEALFGLYAVSVT